MTKYKSVFYTILACVAMLVLILDAKTALTGALDAVWLCLTTIIPSLFPFFAASIFLTGLLAGQRLPFLRPLGKFLHLPENTEPLLLIGFLGGYPVGAQCIAQAHAAGSLSREDSERMLAFCSNAGPSFLFGIGAGVLQDVRLCWLLWGIHILSALIVGRMTPAADMHRYTPVSPHPISITDAVNKSIRVLASVCGWIILFRTVLAFFGRWFLWLLPAEWTILLSGLLELANGCTSLAEISSVGLRFEILAVILSFGGLCVALQTHSVLSGSGLSGRAYFPGKVTQAAISYILCLVSLPLLPEDIKFAPNFLFLTVAVLICLGYQIYHVKNQKRYSIPSAAGV